MWLLLRALERAATDFKRISQKEKSAWIRFSASEKTG